MRFSESGLRTLGSNPHSEEVQTWLAPLVTSWYDIFYIYISHNFDLAFYVLVFDPVGLFFQRCLFQKRFSRQEELDRLGYQWFIPGDLTAQVYYNVCLQNRRFAEFETTILDLSTEQPETSLTWIYSFLCKIQLSYYFSLTVQ